MPKKKRMAQKGYEMVRYADDAVVCCHTETEAQEALAQITAWTEAAGLKLHPTKTRIVSAEGKGGFDFLGYHFERYHEGGGLKWPREKSRKKLRDTLREKLRRGRSGSIPDIILKINPILKGWLGYFKYSVPSAMRDADQWVRDRIRQIVRRRHKRRGIVKGRERIEYPNRWFEAQGSSAWRKLKRNGFNPKWDTTDWKAECQKLACSVWREGERQIRSPYPYQLFTGATTGSTQ